MGTVGTIWRRGGAIALVLILLLGSMPPQPAAARPASTQQPTPPAAEPRYFAETGHYVGGRFREFWEERGGLFVFGLPLTSQFAFPSTDGKVYQVQYFERAVFELHPENRAPFDVLLTQVGREIIAGRLGEPPFQPAEPAPGQPYESATRHNIPDFFLAWWNRYGGLQNFGYPLSEVFFERNAADGKDYAVQYFERGRFELHPENSGTEYEVLLGLMGRERMIRENVPAFARARETAPPLATGPGNARLSATGLPFLRGPHVGIGVQAHWFGQPRGKLLGLVNDVGFSWTKQQVVWRDIETAKGLYAWGELDSIVDDLHAANIKIMLSVVKSPKYLTPTGTDDGTPRDAKDFGDFMRAITERYKGKVSAYELWNEENLAAETGNRINPAFYVELVKAGYGGVKGADPGAIVVLGALSPTGVNDINLAVDDIVYLEQLYQINGGEIRGYFDVLGAHPYGMSNPPETLWSDGKPGPEPKFFEHDSFYFRRIESHYAIMQKYGDGDKQLWLTEWGYGSDFRPDGYNEFNTVSQEMRADYVVRAIKMSRERYPWMGVTFLWNLNWSVIGNWYDGPSHYCIINADYSPRPVYYALKNLPK